MYDNIPEVMDGIDVIESDGIASFEALIEQNQAAPENVFNIVVKIETLYEFIQYVELQMSKTNTNNNSLIFRGHHELSYPLVPSIMRKKIFSHDPPEINEILEYEDRLITEFENRVRAHISVLPREDVSYWEWLARAQHHFLPTRLLDWTERATTALFFAIEKHIEDYACVWAIRAPEELDTRIHKNISTVDTVKLYRPPHIVPRITMQQGCFTVHPSDYLKWPRTWIHGPRVIYVICESKRKDILIGLNAVGINGASLFPDPDGIAKYLKKTIKPKILD